MTRIPPPRPAPPAARHGRPGDPRRGRAAARRGGGEAGVRRAAGSFAATVWWEDGWIEKAVGSAPDRFDRAFDRWRNLFKAALLDQAEQNRRVLDTTLSDRDNKIAVGRRREAETQLDLLKNQSAESRSVLSDFGPHRYLASEGFLPGYSFPGCRWPPTSTCRTAGSVTATTCSAPVPGDPRVRAGRADLPRGRPLPGDPHPAPAGRDGRCRHLRGPPLRRLRLPPRLHPQRRPVPDVRRAAARAQVRAAADAHRLHQGRARISSDEEERRRAGFRLVTSYRFTDHGARPGRQDALVTDDEGEIATLSFGDSATVRITNLVGCAPRTASRTASGSIPRPASG